MGNQWSGTTSAVGTGQKPTPQFAELRIVGGFTGS